MKCQRLRSPNVYKYILSLQISRTGRVETPPCMAWRIAPPCPSPQRRLCGTSLPSIPLPWMTASICMHHCAVPHAPLTTKKPAYLHNQATTKHTCTHHTHTLKQIKRNWCLSSQHRHCHSMQCRMPPYCSPRRP